VKAACAELSGMGVLSPGSFNGSES
jgi:hypothetical protein